MREIPELVTGDHVFFLSAIWQDMVFSTGFAKNLYYVSKVTICAQQVKPYLRNFSFCRVLSMERTREMAADTIQGIL
jgi:hypothetical protein